MKIVAANWKLYKSPAQAREFFKHFIPRLEETSVEVVFFPSAFSLEAAATSLKTTSMILGAQNCYAKSEGAFTGENSAQVAKEIGARYILIGHSERRAIFAETDELIAQKVKMVQDLDLTPMLCIGETLQEREGQKTKAVLERQLKIGLSQASTQKSLVVAYEPVWAIGTGKVASIEQVAETHADVAQILKNLGFTETAILYGGSVKPDNAPALIQQKNVAGFLVGGASLEVESFAKIVEAAKV